MQTLAKQAKSLYRELLAYRAFAERLKMRGYLDVEELIESARQSLEVRDIGNAYSRAIDARIPPLSEAIQDQVLLELIQKLGLDKGEVN